MFNYQFKYKKIFDQKIKLNADLFENYNSIDVLDAIDYFNAYLKSQYYIAGILFQLCYKNQLQISNERILQLLNILKEKKSLFLAIYYIHSDFKYYDKFKDMIENYKKENEQNLIDCKIIEKTVLI